MKAFIIHLPERLHSVEHATLMKNQLQGFGINAELFRGVPGDHAVELAKKSQKTLYPYGIKNNLLSHGELLSMIAPEHKDKFTNEYFSEVYHRKLWTESEVEKASRPGVVGCFYSHYALWQKCMDLQEPIMIFEDDVKFYREYSPVEWDDVLVLSLGKSSFDDEPWKTYLENPPAQAWAATWKNFSMPGASGYALKPAAAQKLVKFYAPYWYPADNAINQFLCRIQVNSRLMGRNTLPEEGNISMTKYKDWNKCE